MCHSDITDGCVLFGDGDITDGCVLCVKVM